MANYILSAFSDEYADSLRDQCEALQNFGIRYTEVRGIDGKNVSVLTEDEIKQVQQTLANYGIGVSAIGSPIGKIPLDGDFDAHLETARRIFTTANLLGTSRVRIFSFYLPTGQTRDDCRAQVLQRLESLIRLAEQYGLTLCHENEALIYGESPERCLDLLRHFGGKLKAVFDMGNFVLDGYDAEQAYVQLKDHIDYFHIKDALYAGAIVPAGMGEAKIRSILTQHAADSTMDTLITLEPHLQTFSGLNALVGKTFRNPYQYPDAKAAFTDAVQKLRAL